jgi:hypothetical protein
MLETSEWLLITKHFSWLSNNLHLNLRIIDQFSQREDLPTFANFG